MDIDSAVFPGPHGEHFAALSRRFAVRSRYFFYLSIGLLAATGALISIGVTVFLFPTYLSDVTVAEAEAEANRAQIAKILAGGTAVIERKEETYSRKASVVPFLAIYEQASVIVNSGATRGKVPTGYKEDAINLLDCIIKVNDCKIEFQRRDGGVIVNPYSQKYGMAGTVEIKASQLGFVRGAMKTTGSDFDQLKEIIASLPDNSATESSAESVIHAPVPEEQLSQDDVEDQPGGDENDPSLGDLEKFRVAEEKLRWAKEAYATAQESYAVAASDFAKHERNHPTEMQAILDLVGENANLAALSVVSERANFFEQWLPVISIRACVVILLLFLTRVLLETYRFATSVSLFYRARSDALAFVARSEMEPCLDLAAYSAFLLAVTPPYQIDKVDSPERYLLSILRPSIELPAQIPAVVRPAVRGESANGPGG